MRKLTLAIALCLGLLGSVVVRADVTLEIGSGDFAIADTFNEITSFNFEIQLTGSIAAGGTYVDPAITRIDYQVFGILPNVTPSGFPGFALSRSYVGAEFYAQSPEATLHFSIDAAADLSDGLQFSELVGTGTDTIFFFDARELNQTPGRYHPPELTLRADGSGQLQNSNNMSTFPNPPPPMGSGLLVDVTFGEEYIADLTFSPSVTLATVPEPGSLGLLHAVLAACLLSRKRRS